MTRGRLTMRSLRLSSRVLLRIAVGIGLVSLLLLLLLILGFGASPIDRASPNRTRDLLLLAVIALGLPGIALWWSDRGAPGSRGSLGSALLTGLIVSLVVLLLQTDMESTREAQSLQLALSMQQDLTGIDLSNRKLFQFYLRGKKLDHANLRRASLHRGNLSRSSLANADFTDALLLDVSLSEPAVRTDADCQLASNLKQARFDDAEIYETDLTGANLEGASFKSATLFRVKLDGANLRNADFSNATILSSSIIGARLDGANLDAALVTHNTEISSAKPRGSCY